MIRVDNEKVHEVESEIFLARFTPDCMTHACRCLDEAGRPLDDACCQHGADMDLFERDAILARAPAVARALDPPLRDPARWFDDSEAEEDLDFPSGTVIRTGLARPGESGSCVFLVEHGRGCALHRAALDEGLPSFALKPMVCRLYPLAFGDGILGLSDDFARYSCANAAGGPTVYRLMRAEVAAMFGGELVAELDRLETSVLRRGRPPALTQPRG